MRRRTARAFAVWMVGIVAVAGGWSWVQSRPEAMGIPSPLRRVLEWNGGIWQAYFSPGRVEKATGSAIGKEARLNGDVGLEEDLEPQTWRLQVQAPTGVTELTLAELQWMPRTESNTEFRCIEGWSMPLDYAGVKFVDFMRKLGLGRRSGLKWEADAPGDPREKIPADLYRYVGLETPDRRYYVSIDMESMLHPQTLLAWEMNGKPLTEEHGAPLRLVIPVKYGIKSLKRVGKIFFSDERPPDYWAERGYDWFAGL